MWRSDTIGERPSDLLISSLKLSVSVAHVDYTREDQVGQNAEGGVVVELPVDVGLLPDTCILLNEDVLLEHAVPHGPSLRGQSKNCSAKKHVLLSKENE